MEVDTFIGLGSNLGKPLAQLRQAYAALCRFPDTSMQAASSIYASAPVGPQNQPDYLNAVVWLQTRLDPFALLALLQEVETLQGRRRNGPRWGARTLDLDLLLYGQHTLAEPQLTVPHREMANRPFVLYPLAEIAAELQIPGMGSLHQLQQRHPEPVPGLTRMEEELTAPFMQDL